MTAATDALVQIICARAGISQEQFAAARHGDLSELLKQATSGAQDAPSGGRDEFIRLESELEDMRARLAAAVGLLRRLADILGCCPRCWGTNSRCPTCRGTGTPGFVPPDPGLSEWLAPAISKLQPPPHQQAFAPHQQTGQGDKP